jgi:hypothetical protein
VLIENNTVTRSGRALYVEWAGAVEVDGNTFDESRQGGLTIAECASATLRDNTFARASTYRPGVFDALRIYNVPGAVTHLDAGLRPCLQWCP